MPDSRNPNVKIHPPGTYGNPGGGYYGDGGYGGGGGGGYGGGDDAYTLREKLRKAEEELRTIKEEPKLVATVVEIRGDHMLISFGPGNSVYVHTFAGARVGDRAICHRNSMQVTETIRDPFPTGEILSVVRVDGDVIEGERLGVPCVFRGQGRKVLQGERVVLDASSTFVIGSLGMPHSNYARAPKVSVAWDDIGGQDEAKDALREAIELPLSHPKLFAAYGKRASKGVLLAGSPGLGKCLGRGTPVLLHNGATKAIEDIVVGDALMGPDSQPRKVRDLGRGRSPMYRVLPVKGTAWTCNDEHILTLAGSADHAGEPVDVSVKDFLLWPKTKREKFKLWRTGVEFAKAVQEVDPYLAGIWLGDGGVDNFEITTMDQEVIDYCTAIAPNYGLVCKVRPTPSRAMSVHLVQENSHPKGVKGVSPNRLRDTWPAFLQDREKFIPQNYLAASREQRYALLAGLLDSDGHLTPDLTVFEILTKSRPLRDGILFLARSLGLAAYSGECEKRIKSIGFVGVYQRITISGDTDCIPTRVARKKARPRKQIKRVSVTGFELEPIGEGDYFGIVIDGDHRFLLGDFTVTHNTLIAKAAATSIAKAHGQDASSGFIYVKGPELLAKWVGQSEEAVRNLFTAARKHFAEHGYPALVFLDECDSLLGARQNGGIHSIGTTLVPQFLAEMDGFDATGALFILATNRPDMLDPAVTREGRIDRKIVLRRPTQLELVRIAEIHLRSKPVAGSQGEPRSAAAARRPSVEGSAELSPDGSLDGSLEGASREAARSRREAASREWLASELARLIFQPGRLTLDLGSGRVIELADHASGALVEGIVDKATTAAIIRDITRGKKQVSGITAADLAFAVDRVQAELRATDQREVMAEVIARIEQEALGQPVAAPP